MKREGRRVVTGLKFIHLTKSQRDSLLGQILWVDFKTGAFYANPTAHTFLQRMGAIDPGQGHLNQAGIFLMADYGNELQWAGVKVYNRE